MHLLDLKNTTNYLKHLGNNQQIGILATNLITHGVFSILFFVNNKKISTIRLANKAPPIRCLLYHTQH